MHLSGWREEQESVTNKEDEMALAIDALQKTLKAKSLAQIVTNDQFHP